MITQLNIDTETFNNSEHTFDKATDCNSLFTEKHNLNIISQNIRSIRKNFDNFSILLNEINISFDIIILTECWLDDSYTNLNLKDYTTLHSTKHLNQNDGIVIFAKDSLNSSITEINLTEANCIKISLGPDISIFAVYRPPCYNNLSPFFNSLNKLLEKNKKTQQLIIAGDMNINLLNGQPITTEYLSLLTHYGFNSTINSPTRITSNSESCIDHIFVKTKKKTSSSIIRSTVTDHFTTTLSIHLNKKQKEEKNTSVQDKINFKSLIEDIHNESWSNVLNEPDPNNALNTFMNTIGTYITKNTTKNTPKNYSHKEKKITPWITKGLVNSIHKRDTMHMQVRKYPYDDKLKNNYLLYRNLCNKLIKQAKYKYYKKEIKTAKNDPKKIWKIVKDITFSNPKNDSKIKALLINGNKTLTKNEPGKVANFINSQFAKVGSNLAEKILLKNGTTEDSLTKLSSTIQPIHSFHAHKISTKEISDLIISLKPNCAVGPDNLSNHILICLREHILIPLQHIFNQSFSLGIVPDNLKIGCITPIHKSGDKMLILNYRPITLLNSLSKILEKTMKKRLLAYLDKHKLISTRQFGFRAKMGTEDALSELTTYIVKNLDGGSKVLGVFLDLAKAFDTISHKLLQQKLKNIGITGPPLKWFISYIENRQQIVKINNQESDKVGNRYGVPQGSVLGPILFLIYINSLTEISLGNIEYKVISYADDTVILFKAQSWENVFKNTEAGMTEVNKWLINNLLTLNISKTKYLTFSKTLAGQPDSRPQLHLHPCTVTSLTNSRCVCDKIDYAQNIKYLGLTVDNNLKWDLQINLITNKIRKLSYIFKIIRNIMSLPQLKNIYFALCQSTLMYGISVWGAAAETHLKSLKINHKTIIRIMFRKPYQHPTEQLMNNNNLLDINKLFIKKIIYKNCIKISPQFITHSQNTRANTHNQLQVPYIKSNSAKKHESYLAPYIFNKFVAQTKTYVTPNNLNWVFKRFLNWLNVKERREISNILNI